MKSETFQDPSALLAATRTDLQAFSERVFYALHPDKPFLSNWHTTAVSHALKRCLGGEVKRLVILLPPRHLKSTLVSVAFTAFILGQKPSAKLICASYATQLAADLSNRTRKVLDQHWYQQAFPSTKIGETDKQEFFKTTAGGYRFATTPGGAMTGMGADWIILDDPQKAADMVHENARNEAKSWLDNTVYSRLDDPKSGVIIIVMQRLHEDDLIGHVLQGTGWEVIKIPVMAEEDLTYQLSDNHWHCFKKGELLQPARFGQKEFDTNRDNMGTAHFYAQYQQSPVPPSGNIFDWKWFRLELAPPAFSEVIMSLDVAATNASGNYSAVTVWGHRDKSWYFLAAHRFQYELPEVRARLLELDKHYRPDLIIIDNVGVGLGLAQELRAQGIKHIQTSGSGGKVSNAEQIAPMIEGGRVFYLPDALGLAAFRDELIAFPKGKYDDQVDSMVQVLVNGPRVVACAQQFKRPERKGIKSTNGQLSIKVIKIQSPW